MVASFRFLHAADIHLDSPLHGLSRYEGLPVEELRSATRAAFDNLVRYAIDEAVDFVVIAGDLFDGDWRDMGTGLYFARAMGRLDQAGIPAFVLAGNHDAASTITRTIPWPPNVRLFATRRPETHRLPDLSVAIHGQSFSTPAVTDNLVERYPAAEPHFFNIGVLHTALAGRRGHENYAPCDLDDLRGRGYDYWALGHVHEFEIVSDDPHVVFPGNVQGRTIRETGAKGAVVVTVADREVVSIERVELDVVRWARLDVDCSGMVEGDVSDHLRPELHRVHGANGSGRPLVVRVTLVGETGQAGMLYDRSAFLRDEVRAVAAGISPDLLIEKVIVAVSEPKQAVIVAAEGLDAMIEEATNDPGLAQAVAADLERFMLSVGATLEASEEGPLRGAASRQDWAAVLGTAAIALRARMTGAN